MDVLHDQICDSSVVEAIVDLRDTRCVRILDSLVVDLPLCISIGVDTRVLITPFDEVGFRYYATAKGGVQPRHHDVDAPGAGFDDYISELGLFGRWHGSEAGYYHRERIANGRRKYADVGW